MVHDPGLLDQLEQLDPKSWEGRVFRRVAWRRLRRTNQNEREIAVEYLLVRLRSIRARRRRQLSRRASAFIASQPVPPRAPRHVYEITLSLRSVVRSMHRWWANSTRSDLHQTSCPATIGARVSVLAVPWRGSVGTRDCLCRRLAIRM